MRAPRTPQERLASRWWRLLNSWWVLLPLFSFGLLAWAGFLYIGISARHRAWSIWGLVYAASVTAGQMIMPNGTTGGPGADLGGGLIIGTWAVASVHALIVNRDWLRRRAAAGPWYAQGWAEPVPSLSPAPVVDPARHSGEAPAARIVDAPVDANTASAAELAQLLGLTPSRTERIVHVRRQRGGFTGLDDFAAVAELAPHELVRIREFVRFSPFTPPTAGPIGRILDV